MRRHRTLLALLPLALCCGEGVDLNQVPLAKARCESSTEELRVAGARMLPGRRCQGCHLPGGQAGRYPWTASGTLYSRGDSDCNVNGVEGAQVEILDEAGQTLVTMTSNRAGNFFTAEPLGFGRYRARVSLGGRTREMSTAQTETDCAACHYPGGPAGGRISLE